MATFEYEVNLEFDIRKFKINNVPIILFVCLSLLNLNIDNIDHLINYSIENYVILSQHYDGIFQFSSRF